MPRQCTICRHEKVDQIDKSIGLRRSPRVISEEFRVSQSSVQRHRAHMARSGAITLEELKSPDEVSRLKAVAQRVVDSTRDDKVRIAALRELRGYLELEARLQQEAQGTTSLVNDAAYQQIVATIVMHACADCMSRFDEELRKLIGTPLSTTVVATPGDTPPENGPRGGGEAALADAPVF